MLPNLKPGDIVFQKPSKPNFITKGIEFFTSYELTGNANESFSHVMHITSTDYLGVTVVETAERTNGIRPLSDYSVYIVYRLKKVNEKDIIDTLQQEFLNGAEKKYNKLQILWFIYAWLKERVFKSKIDRNKAKNFFPNGPICAERAYRFLLLYLFKDIPLDTEYKALRSLMLRYNENTISPNGLLNIIANSEAFERVYDSRSRN